MRAWRALKGSGAASLRDGAYLLPVGAAHHAALAKVAEDIDAAGGQAWLLATEPLDAPFATLFDRAEDYQRLAADIELALVTLETDAAADMPRLARKLRKQFTALAGSEFFPGEAQRQVLARLDELDRRLRAGMAPGEPSPRAATIARLDTDPVFLYVPAGEAFAGGLVVDALLSLWLFQRFGMSLAAAGMFFFWAGLFSAASQLAAPWVARRIGLLNTMVFAHIPSSLFLILAAFAPSLPLALGLLLARALLSQMDVPTRSAFVMAVVTPAERAAAASLTAVPRGLAAALSPALGGALFAAGWLAAPLALCGGLKISYDLLLLAAFRNQRTGE